MNSDFRSFVRIFITGCLWGTIGLFVKLMEAQGSTSSYTSFLRLFFGFILLIVMTLIFDGPKAFRIGRRTLLSCVLLGIICQGIFNILYSRSISMNGMSVGSVLLYTAPVFTSIASLLLFKERLNLLKWIALLINVAGCALTATGGNFSAASVMPLGLLIGVGAGFTYAMTAVIGRIAMQEKASPFAVAAYNLFFGCLFIALAGRPWRTVEAPLNTKLLLYGFLFGLIATALAYALYFSGLSGIRQTGKVPVVASVELVVATIIGACAFSESITVIKVIGILLVLLSILLFSGKSNAFTYLTLRENPALKKEAAEWFHSKWGVPEEAYLECMESYLNNETEYGWYLCMDGSKIVGGMGVIENDFHDRKDLRPNICAVYTEEAYRGKGIAGHLLDMTVNDLKAKGISPVYLVTDHIGFYERYGWEFLCMVQGDGELDLTRMYIHQ